VSGGSGAISAANVTSVFVSCTGGTPVSGAADDFNRANGGLGPNWSDISGGGLAISSGAVAGTSSGGDGRPAGRRDLRRQPVLPGPGHLHPTHRESVDRAGCARPNGGQDAYVGMYNWNSGSPGLKLFKRISGGWTQLGSAYNSGALAAGTELKLMVVGTTIAFMENGVERIAVGDTSLSGGAPGIIANGTGHAITGRAERPASRFTI